MREIDGDITIVETTVGDLDGLSVGVGNIWDGEVSLTTWSETLPELRRRVAVGACIAAGDANWLVVAIADPPGALGSVTLRRVPPATLP